MQDVSCRYMRWIAWDFDGTLATRDGMWSGALVEVAEQRGYRVDRETLAQHLMTGFPWHTPEVVRPCNEHPETWWGRLQGLFAVAYEKGGGIPASASATLAAQVRDVYIDSSRWSVFDDVTPALTRLASAGWHNLILSNHIPELRDLVAELGLADHFEAVLSSAETGAEKPNPAAFRHARRHIGSADELWMVGDSWEADVCGARNVGINAILVRDSNPDSTHTCELLTDIPRLLEESS